MSQASITSSMMPSPIGNWYKAKGYEASETPPLQSGIKNLPEQIVDSFWTAEQMIESALVCARSGLPDDARALLGEAKRWREIGANLID